MLKENFNRISRSHETTGDKAKDPLLKTRYFKLPKEQVWEEVTAVLKKTPGYKLLHEVPNVGEILAERKTMTGQNPRCYIDIVCYKSSENGC